MLIVELTTRAKDRRLPDMGGSESASGPGTTLSLKGGNPYEHIPLYKTFIEVGASEDSATKAAEDVIRVSQLEQLATKSDLKSEIAGLEARLVKWMVGSLFVFAGIIIASVGILIQILLSPGVVQ